jgi:hypothetical protein
METGKVQIGGLFGGVGGSGSGPSSATPSKGGMPMDDARLLLRVPKLEGTRRSPKKLKRIRDRVSCESMLKKCPNFRAAFDKLDPSKVARSAQKHGLKRTPAPRVAMDAGRACGHDSGGGRRAGLGA